MPRIKSRYQRRFADALARGDMFSLKQDGSDPVEILADPVRVSNLVGNRTHMYVKVRRVHTAVQGEMIFTPTSLVHVWTEGD